MRGDVSANKQRRPYTEEFNTTQKSCNVREHRDRVETWAFQRGATDVNPNVHEVLRECATSQFLGPIQNHTLEHVTQGPDRAGITFRMI